VLAALGFFIGMITQLEKEVNQEIVLKKIENPT
jgi:hypothetical protein